MFADFVLKGKAPRKQLAAKSAARKTAAVSFLFLLIDFNLHIFGRRLLVV